MANNVLQTLLDFVTLTFRFKTLFNGVGSNLGMASFVFLIHFFLFIFFYRIFFLFLVSSILTASFVRFL